PVPIVDLVTGPADPRSIGRRQSPNSRRQRKRATHARRGRDPEAPPVVGSEEGSERHGEQTKNDGKRDGPEDSPRHAVRERPEQLRGEWVQGNRQSGEGQSRARDRTS